MKKKLLLTAIATMMVATLFTGCGGSATTDTEPTEHAKVENSNTPTNETHKHNYTETITIEATCTEAGEKTFTCECGDSYTEVITATGHVFNEYVYNEDATYTSDGTETAICACGETDTKTKAGSKLEYTYTDLDKIMYAKSSVNVRSLPTSDGEKLGGLSKTQEVHVTGQCNETSWYRIDYNGSVAYVSNSYLLNEKPVEETPVPEEPSQPSETEQPECPYTLYEVEDNWTSISWYYVNGDPYASEFDKTQMFLERHNVTFDQITFPTEFTGYFVDGKPVYHITLSLK